MQCQALQNSSLQAQRPALPSRAAAARCMRSGRRARLHISAAVKRGSDKTVVCSKTVVAKLGSEKAVQDLCQKVVDFSVREMEDRSNGILEFGCNHDLEDKNVFHFWERYTSNTTMGRHNVKKPMIEFMEKVQPFSEKPVGLALYEMKGGEISNIMMQGGPKGEGGLDDATGGSGGGSGGGASFKQTSSVVDLGESLTEEKQEAAWGMKVPAWFKKVTEKIIK
eukprot:CAMPEP_0206144636 /NCGR_PEP_ID=MMETSP1473-20131121/24676_1 /ASSEMBLY_ACC=CAM_ASM_001109 /TAXON_ID=1461547 /ORGANISM="Stichococcus sp, Strain RCC1054" /LENGTH=222 /DNA_ID=CAMNT_0053540501 /DNA_START=197 /DNA_END=865 /DNA_ORIENTATION=+